MCVAVNKKIEKEVEGYEEMYRGRELPGFINYKTFEVMVKEQVKQLEEPAVKRLKDIGGILLNIDRFVFSIAHAFPYYHTTFCEVKEVGIKLLDLVPFLFPPDAVRKVFIQLAQSSFTGFPNLVKTAKVHIF